MIEHWTDRLSDYLDGDLDAPDRDACEAHLERCPSCAATLEELRAVVAEAALLPDLPPERDLWPAIEGQLEPRKSTRSTRVFTFPSLPTRRVSFSIPQLAAAAIALIMISAGSVWLLVPAETGPAVVARAPAQGAAIPVVMTDAYEETVRELEAEFGRRRPDLDPETIRVVEANLAIIDAAIAEARAALAEDPSSAFLNTHLASAMRQKVQLLRQAATIETTEI